MSLLIIYALTIITILSTYLFWNGDLELSDFSDTIKFVFNGVEKKDKKTQPKECNLEVEENYIESTRRIILDKSLKHLDFITKLESHMESSDTSLLPLEFLQKIEKIKIEAQLSALKTASKMNVTVKVAA